MAMTVAQYRKVREGLELTQPALAELLGVHWMTISKRERGVFGKFIKREPELALRMVELQAKYEIVVEEG